MRIFTRHGELTSRISSPVADLSDHGPVIALQVGLGQWQSFTGMEHGALHKRAAYMATGFEREVAGFENSGLEFFFLSPHVP